MVYYLKSNVFIIILIKTKESILLKRFTYFNLIKLIQYFSIYINNE